MKTTTPPSPFAISNVRRFIAFRVCFNARFYYPVFAVLFLRALFCLSAGVFSYNVRCVNGIRAAAVETSTFVTISTGSSAMKPMQVKIFYDGGHIPSERFESIITNLSNKVNAWLEDHPDIEVVNMLQSESQGSENAWNLTLSIFYR